MKSYRIKFVKEIPDDFFLVQDSQDIECIKEYFPVIGFDDYGCLFVRTEDGEYKEIYGCISYTPYNNNSVFKLL